MIEYKAVKKEENGNIEILNNLGKDNWQLICIESGIMIFSRKIVKTRTQKKAELSKEFLEFKEKYKKIKSNGLSADSLIIKYNECIKKGLHSKIMKNLDLYINYLEIGDNSKYGLMASTYINQKRFNDEWEVVKDMSEKWIDDIFKERLIDSYVQETVLTMKEDWKIKNPHREHSSGVINNMIDSVLGINQDE